jgi:hypothetical protein
VVVNLTNESVQSSASSSQEQENLKDKIKKTVEKYYTAQKTKG